MIQGSYLSNRWFILASVWVFVGVVGMVFPMIFPVYIAAGLVLLSLILWDYRQLSKEDGIQLSLQLPSTMELGRTYEVPIQIDDSKSNRSSAAQRLFAPRMELYEHSKESATYTIRQQQATMSIRPTRLGYASVPGASVLVNSRFGFWNRIIALPYVRPYMVRVLPLRKQIEESKVAQLLTRQKIMMMGERVLVRGASNDQFHSVRPYRYPDPVRHIDHRKTAKFQELMTRQFDSLQSHHLCIVLDLGRSMCGMIGHSHKEDFYLAVAYSLAEYALQKGDRVTIIGFSDHIHFCEANKSRIEAFHRLYQGTPETRARATSSDYAVLEQVIARQVMQQSLLVVLSDALRPAGVEASLPSLSRLATRHLVLMLSLLPHHLSLERALTLANDYEVTDDILSYLLYLHHVQQRQQEIEERLLRSQVSSIFVTEDYWMTAALKIYQRMRRLAA